MKGILFKEDLFNAVVNGTKTKTRRLFPVKTDEVTDWYNFTPALDWNCKPGFYCEDENGEGKCIVPRYKKDEIVFLKEPYHIGLHGKPVYKYGRTESCKLADMINEVKWKNKLFMGAVFARYYIKITGVTVERLHDITEEGAKAEGVQPDRFLGYGRIGMKSYKEGFIGKWVDINGAKSWNENPWVFVYSFEFVK